MPAWSELQEEVRASGSVYDQARRKYIQQLAELTGRNVIVYYSGWLQKPELQARGFNGFSINDLDKNGLMAAIHKMDRTKGLDLILHTPGGEASATESIVDYLRQMFDTDIRAIVPQIAMSAGTLIACACKEIIMGKQSSIGPIDPQIAGMAAHGVMEELEQAKAEIQKNQLMIHIWQPIIAKYPPTLIGECTKALNLAEKLAIHYLESGMFKDDAQAKEKAKKVVKVIADHKETMSHSRHISRKAAKDMGLNVTFLEELHKDADKNDPDKFQDLVLTIHHACMLTLQDTAAVKIIENQLDRGYIMSVQINKG